MFLILSEILKVCDLFCRSILSYLLLRFCLGRGLGGVVGEAWFGEVWFGCDRDVVEVCVVFCFVFVLLEVLGVLG